MNYEVTLTISFQSRLSFDGLVYQSIIEMDINKLEIHINNCQIPQNHLHCNIHN